jgi:hypothetical protein
MPQLSRCSLRYYRHARGKKTLPTGTGLCPAAPSDGGEGREARLGRLASGDVDEAFGPPVAYEVTWEARVLFHSVQTRKL